MIAGKVRGKCRIQTEVLRSLRLIFADWCAPDRVVAEPEFVQTRNGSLHTKQALLAVAANKA